MKTIIANLLIAIAFVYPLNVCAQSESEGEVGNEVGAAPSNNIWNVQPRVEDRQIAEEQEVPLDAPIDGGLGILLFAGVAYGAKKALANKSSK